MFLPEDVKRIISLLRQSSYKAYAVGGCVRDWVMGREVSDYDITTSAYPEQVEAVLNENGIKYIETGIKHGTVTAIINHNPYEITTFRRDGEYLDKRHPENVLFVDDVKEDLSRRDFTMNAIAYNDSEGYVDLFGGISDINNKIIKTVGDSNLRFNEDALRIMRALRFSSQLNFRIEENTKEAIFKNKNLLMNIACERIYAELVKLLLGDYAAAVLEEYRETIEVIIPEIRGAQISALAYAPKKEYIRLALINCSGESLKRLKVSNDIFNKTTALINHSKAALKNDKACIKKLLNVIGKELFFDLLDYKKALLLSEDNDISELEKIRKTALEIIKNKEPYLIKHLDINGFDLMALGFEGKEISKMLDKLLGEVIINPEINRKELLINTSKQIKC